MDDKLENEKAVIGAMCCDPDEADAAFTLRPDDFTGKHREIYRVAKDLYGRGVIPDLVALNNELDAIGKLASVGGSAYLSDLVIFVPHVANVGYYVSKVREESHRRRLRSLSMLLNSNCDTMPVKELLASIDGCADVLRGTESKGPEKISVAIGKAFKQMELATLNKGEITGVSTGLPDLDIMLAGLNPGKLYILAGRPGMGKSALALDMARHASRGLDGTPVLFFSHEMPDVELAQRSLCSEGRVDGAVARIGGMTSADFSRLGDAANVLHQSNLWIDDTPVMTAAGIAAKAKAMKKKHGLGLVIIDYLQLLDGEGKRYEIVTEASRRLKLLSKEIDAPVVALCQLNRSLESREDKRPKMSDLRESGALEQDADVILFVYREAIYCECKGNKDCSHDHHRKAEVIVGKQRGGPCGTVHCEYIGEHTTFRPKQGGYHDRT
jgi:replicative DNA helicase